MEYFNIGNHGEQPMIHLQYEDYKFTTPAGGSTISPVSWCKIIDKDMYYDTYLQANPQTVIPPTIKRVVTSFLLYSGRTDNGFYSAIVTIRVNISSDQSRVNVDILPLTNSKSGIENAKPRYDDLIRAYFEDLTNGRYNLKVFIKYPLPLNFWKIKSLYTILNDDIAYYYSYTDFLLTKNGIGKYPKTEYRRNQFLFIAETDLTLISESSLPVESGTIKLYKGVNILSNLLDVNQLTYYPFAASSVERNSVYVDSNDYTLRFRQNDGNTWALQLIQYGTTANRPTQGLYTGRIYFDTTIQELVQWNGSSWVNTRGVLGGQKAIGVVVTSGVSYIDILLPQNDINANYMPHITVGWNTNYWITNKTASGFRVNFGTAPSTASTIDWFIMR